VQLYSHHTAALVLAVVLLGLVSAAAAAAQATLSCPATAQAGQRFVTELTIDVRPTTALGAYSVTLTSDPAVATLAAITCAGTSPAMPSRTGSVRAQRRIDSGTHPTARRAPKPCPRAPQPRGVPLHPIEAMVIGTSYSLAAAAVRDR